MSDDDWGWLEILKDRDLSIAEFHAMQLEIARKVERLRDRVAKLERMNEGAAKFSARARSPYGGMMTDDDILALANKHGIGYNSYSTPYNARSIGFARAVAARARAEALEEAATTINNRAADYCVRADTAKSVWDRGELLHTAVMLDALAAAIRARAAEGGERG